MAERALMSGEDLCSGRRLRPIPLLGNSDTARSKHRPGAVTVTKETQRTECQHTDQSDWPKSP